jgi:hypothetical protein
MSDSLASVLQAALKPQRLALKATRQPRLIPAIIEGLKADKPRVKYGCAKALRLVSEQRPEVLYPHFDFFVHLLEHENKIFQWNAACVLSHLARVDVQDKFAAIFKQYFSPILGPVMITAANVMQGGARVAQAKPQLAGRIAEEILKVARARYQTTECRNVAIGHAIIALGKMLPLLPNPAPAVRFVRKQTRNPRPATRKKAERFLKLRLGTLGSPR